MRKPHGELRRVHGKRLCHEDLRELPEHMRPAGRRLWRCHLQLWHVPERSSLRRRRSAEPMRRSRRRRVRTSYLRAARHPVRAGRRRLRWPHRDLRKLPDGPGVRRRRRPRRLRGFVHTAYVRPAKHRMRPRGRRLRKRPFMRRLHVTAHVRRRWRTRALRSPLVRAAYVLAAQHRVRSCRRRLRGPARLRGVPERRRLRRRWRSGTLQPHQLSCRERRTSGEGQRRPRSFLFGRRDSVTADDRVQEAAEAIDRHDDLVADLDPRRKGPRTTGTGQVVRSHTGRHVSIFPAALPDCPGSRELLCKTHGYRRAPHRRNMVVHTRSVLAPRRYGMPARRAEFRLRAGRAKSAWMRRHKM